LDIPNANNALEILDEQRDDIMKEQTPEQKFIAFLRMPIQPPQSGAKYREVVLRQYRKMRKAEQGPRWWDLHDHIAKEIVYGMDMLIKHNKGYPGVFDRLPNGKFPEKQKYSKANERKWLAVMKEIQDGFRLYVDCYGDFIEWKDGKVPPTKWTKLPDGGSRMEPTPKGFKLIKNKEKTRKFKRAFALFVKHFDNFWD
jgi:hypothetical protein